MSSRCVCYASLCRRETEKERKIRTAFFFSRIAVRSARAFSWLLRFLSRVSGTRIWSLVGTVLYSLRLVRSPAYRGYGMEQSAGARSVAEARHSALADSKMDLIDENGQCIVYTMTFVHVASIDNTPDETSGKRRSQQFSRTFSVPTAEATMTFRAKQASSPTPQAASLHPQSVSQP